MRSETRHEFEALWQIDCSEDVRPPKHQLRAHGREGVSVHAYDGLVPKGFANFCHEKRWIILVGLGHLEVSIDPILDRWTLRLAYQPVQESDGSRGVAA